MSDTLLKINIREGSFNDVVSTKKVSSILRTTGDTFQTKEKYFAEPVNLSANTSVGFAREIMWSIPVSDHFVRDFVLHIQVTDPGAATTIGPLGLVHAIDYYRYEISGNRVLQVPGWALAQFLMVINTSQDMRARLIADMGGSALYDFNGGTAEFNYFIPLVGLGTTGIYSDRGDNRQACFPVGLLKDNVRIIVKFLAAALISGTTSIAFDGVTLRYDRFDIHGKTGNPSTNAGKTVVYSYNFPHIEAYTYSRAQTSGSNDQIQIDNIINNADIQFLMVSVLNATEKSALLYAESSSIPVLSLTIKGSDIIYAHASQQEANWRHHKSFKTHPYHNATPGTAGHLAFYDIPISADFAWVVTAYGSAGVNLLNNKPLLTMQASETSTNDVRVAVVTKSTYQIYADQTGQEITHW